MMGKLAEPMVLVFPGRNIFHITIFPFTCLAFNPTQQVLDQLFTG